MINTEYKRGGAAKIACTLYKALNKRDEITCCFAYGRGKGPVEEKFYKFDLIHLQNIHGYFLNLDFIKFLGK